MATKKYFWLKLKDDFFREKEIKKLRKIAGGDTYTIIYLKMLLLSLGKEGRLYFEGIEDSFVEEVALEIDEDVENVKVTVLFLKKCNLLEELSENEFMLIQAANNIGSETQGAERVRRFRESQKALLCNTGVTNCNTEIEIEIEKEIELDKDKDKDKDIKQKPKKNPAHQYGEYKNVLLTDDELEKLKTEFPSDWQERIERLSCYIASKGTKYKNHLATIRNWARKDRGEQNAKDGSRHGLPKDIATKIRECGLDPNDATDVQYFNSYGKYCYDAKKAGYPPVKEKQA